MYSSPPPPIAVTAPPFSNHPLRLLRIAGEYREKLCIGGDKMAKPKEQRGPDWLDRILDEFKARKERGESPSLVYLLEKLLNELMKRERKSNCVGSQGVSTPGFQALPLLTIAFRITRSFLIQATSATFAGFPAPLSLR